MREREGERERSKESKVTIITYQHVVSAAAAVAAVAAVAAAVGGRPPQKLLEPVERLRTSL